MSTILSYLAAFLVLSVLIVVHELGHFGVGRLLGFDILEFAVGMGPKIFSVKRKGITYALRAFPIGGMCRFYGEDESTTGETAEDGHKLVGFTSQPVWKRALVIVAGAVMNILFAFVAAIVFLMAVGQYVDKPQIVGVDEGLPAYEAGLLEGDIVTAVNDTEMTSVNDLAETIRQVEGDDMTVTVDRNGEIVVIDVDGIYNEEKNANYIGISIYYATEKLDFFEAVGGSADYVWQMFLQTLQFFGNLFKGQVTQEDVGSIVEIVSMLSEAVRTGFSQVLSLAIALSATLAFFNLIPFPGLDGGRLVFIAIEAIRGKPVKQETEGVVHMIGLVLLILLVIYITVFDVIDIIG